RDYAPETPRDRDRGGSDRVGTDPAHVGCGRPIRSVIEIDTDGTPGRVHTVHDGALLHRKPVAVGPGVDAGLAPTAQDHCRPVLLVAKEVRGVPVEHASGFLSHHVEDPLRTALPGDGQRDAMEGCLLDQMAIAFRDVAYDGDE